jgi:hypothetical protein
MTVYRLVSDVEAAAAGEAVKLHPRSLPRKGSAKRLDIGDVGSPAKPAFLRDGSTTHPV